MKGRLLVWLALFLVIVFPSAGEALPSRLDSVRARGYLVCGVAENMPGFSVLDRKGDAEGFDADFCRAMAAAIFGKATAVRFEPVNTVEDFLQSAEIDLVFHQLTWKLDREARWGVAFGPVIWFDGQALAVRADGPGDAIVSAKDISGPICVEVASAKVAALKDFLGRTGAHNEVVLVGDRRQVRDALLAGVCGAWSDDASFLGSVLAGPDARRFRILPERLTSEPLAPVFRKEDRDLQDVARWTFLALVDAEAAESTAAGHSRLACSDHPGLYPQWADRVTRAVGTFGELYNRHFTTSLWPQHARGANRLWLQGGLISASSRDESSSQRGAGCEGEAAQP